MTTIIHIIAAVVLASRLHAQPVITNAAAKHISHSAAVVEWDQTGTGTMSDMIVLCGTTTGVYTGHTWWQRDLSIAHYEMAISGLAASTQYFCVAKSTDSGGVGTSSEFNFTTIAQSSGEPTRPTNWDSEYPDTGAYNPVTSSCAGLQADINTAAPLHGAVSGAVGQILKLPAGTTCTITTSLTTPIYPDVKSFTPANVNDSTDTLTVADTAFSENQEIMFGSGSGACLPGADPSSPDAFCQYRGPIIRGAKYFAVSVSGTSFKVSRTSGGAAIDIPAGLTGTNTNYVMPYERTSPKEMIIRPDCADDQLPPPGVRLDPAIWPCVVTLQIAGGTWDNSLFIFQPGMGAHHIRFVGIRFTHTDATANLSGSTDPRPTLGLIDLPWSAALSYINFDRCHLHGLGYPNRLHRPVYNSDGHHISFQDGRQDGIDFWRPGRTGWGVTFTDPTVTIASGTYQLDAATACASSGLTFTRTNATVATSYAYLTKTCVPTIVLPTSGTGTCTGTATLNGGSPIACVVTNAATPGWPLDSFGGHASGPLAVISAGGGIWTGAVSALLNFTYHPSIYFSEGSTNIAGHGPGPFKLRNNYIESAGGISWHFDDSLKSCHYLSQPCPSGIISERNTFYVPPWSRTNGTGSQGIRYINRNGPENKSWDGPILWRGNIFEGHYADTPTALACGILITPVGSRLSNITIEYNTFKNSACGVGVRGGLPTSNNQGIYGAINTIGAADYIKRVAIRHNVVANINTWTYIEPQGRATSTALPIFMGMAMEDVDVSNNLAFDPRGATSYPIHWLQNNAAGMSLRDNILSFSLDHPTYGIGFEVDARNEPDCASATDIKTCLDRVWQRGLTANYDFKRNLIVPLYTDSSVPSGTVSEATTSTQYAGLDATVRTGASAQARIDAISFTDTASGKFRLRYNSPYLTTGNGGRPSGPDITASEIAQGLVTNAGPVATGTTTATIAWKSHDGTACSLDYSTDRSLLTDRSSGTWTRATGASNRTMFPRVQSVNLTGLSANTRYYFQVLCPGGTDQPLGVFTTQ